MGNSQSSVSTSGPPFGKPSTADKSLIPITRRWISMMAFTAGLAIFALGCYLETRNPRSNAEDNFAWFVLAIGVSLGSYGLALWFFRPVFAFVVSVVAPPLAFYLAVVVFWTCLIATGIQNRHHQDFAANGVSQIAPAMQMDEMFDDCRHYITYDQNRTPLFNSIAYFGDRYELSMQVPVEIKSKSSGSIIGVPRFYLNEIREITVSPTGQVGASFSRNLDFGPAEWKQVYDADGDFTKLGFVIDRTAVPNFQKYANASRPSN